MFFSRKKIIFLTIFIILFMSVSIQIAAGASSTKDLKNIVLVTLDTLRSDHLGCYGYKSIETPNIDRLAKEGIMFTNAYSPVPLTFPSHVSIMTSQYPIRHGVQNNGTSILSDSAKTLAEILKDSGYRTGAVIASYILASHFGMNQGFDDYDDNVYQNVGEIPSKMHNYRIGSDITKSAKKWLNENHNKQFFLWVHYFDPHTPYDPPPPFDQSYKERPYDGEIAYTDQCLGDLLKEMKKLSLLKNTCIIVVSDHGEGLWEHDEQKHGVFIYDTTLRVPLIMHYPKFFPKGKKITSLVRIIDIMPTILELSGIKSEDNSFQGVSLMSVITGNEKDVRLNLFCESRYPELNFNWAPLEGIVTFEGWKYINAPKSELYDLTKDPHEMENLLLKMPEKAKFMQDRLQELKKDLSLKSHEQEVSKPIAISPEMKERLRSLGYVSFDSSGYEEKGNQPGSPPPDPKDKVYILKQLETAQDLEAKGELDKVIPKYKEVLEKDPDNKMALYYLGLAYKNTGEPNKALREIEKLAELDPQNLDCQNVLGQIYDILAEPAKSIQAYKKALNLNPNVAYIRNNLGTVYLKINTLESATEEFQQVISLSQDPVLTSIAVGSLGGIDFIRGHLEEAEKKFIKSISLNLFNHESHIGLADTYYSLGNIDQSIKEWKKILDLWPDDYIACYKIAQLFLKADKTEQAILYLKKSIRIRPDYIDAKILLDQIYQRITLINQF